MNVFNDTLNSLCYLLDCSNIDDLMILTCIMLSTELVLCHYDIRPFGQFAYNFRQLTGSFHLDIVLSRKTYYNILSRTCCFLLQSVTGTHHV